MTWDPIPGKQPKRAPVRVTDDVEFIVSSKAKIKDNTKGELVEEVHRLQTVVREVAVELGLARHKKSSPFRIDLHFAVNITRIIKVSWGFNL